MSTATFPEGSSNSSVFEADLQRHFLNLYAMALSDLSVEPEELKLLFDIGERRGVSRSRIEALLLDPKDVDFTIPEDVVDRVEYLYDLALMIWSDGVVDPEERRLLKKFCHRFKFAPENTDELVDFLLGQAEEGASVEKVRSVVAEHAQS